MKTMKLYQMHRSLQVNHAIVAALGLLLAVPAFAETAGPRPTPPIMQELDRLTESEIRPKGPPRTESEEGGGHSEAKKRDRLMQVLQVDDTTRAKLMQRLEQLDQRGDELRRQRREAFLALRDQVKGLRKEGRRGLRDKNGKGPQESPGAGSPADEGVLRGALERVYSVEDAMAALRRERMQVGRDLLTPEQQVRLLLFNMKFHKEMRERHQQEQGK